MNSSKKLIIVRIVVVLVVLIFIGLFIFLIIKIDVVGHLFNGKSYVRSASGSNLNGYLSELNDREYIKETKETKERKRVWQDKREKKDKVVDKSIFKYIEAIRNKKGTTINDGAHITRTYDEVYSNKNVGASYASPNEKQEEIDKEIKKIQSVYDKGYYPKNAFVIIDEDLDGYGFNYYFNNKGKLVADTVSSDYRIVDKFGREVDEDLEPIIYKVELIDHKIISSNSEALIKGYTSNQTIISPGVTLKEESKIYDNRMNRHVIDYINSSLRFKKTTNGTIYDGSKWKSVSSLIDNGGYVIFNNPKNNFNKMVGKIAMQKIGSKDDTETECTLYVYDADLYEMYKDYEYMIDPLFETSAFNYSEPLDFSFTFYRTVKRLRFQIETSGGSKLRTCYLKDLRYGFNNVKYKEELEEAKENEEYIAYLKELGLYQSDEEMLAELRALEEDSTSDYLEYEDFNDIDIYNNVDLSDYDRDYDKEQRAIDRRTGPAFDEYLRSLKNYWEIEYGPGYE